MLLLCWDKEISDADLMENKIDVTWGQSIIDEISFMRGTFTEEYQKYIVFC